VNKGKRSKDAQYSTEQQQQTQEFEIAFHDYQANHGLGSGSSGADSLTQMRRNEFRKLWEIQTSADSETDDDSPVFERNISGDDPGVDIAGLSQSCQQAGLSHNSGTNWHVDNPEPSGFEASDVEAVGPSQSSHNSGTNWRVVNDSPVMDHVASGDDEAYYDQGLNSDEEEEDDDEDGETLGAHQRTRDLFRYCGENYFNEDIKIQLHNYVSETSAIAALRSGKQIGNDVSPLHKKLAFGELFLYSPSGLHRIMSKMQPTNKNGIWIDGQPPNPEDCMLPTYFLWVPHLTYWYIKFRCPKCKTGHLNPRGFADYPRKIYDSYGTFLLYSRQ
jgi:hypothetical protein